MTIYNSSRPDYPPSTLRAVWQKGRPIPGFDSDVWRHDRYGAVMRYSAHGDRQHDHGWEVDHIIPVAGGGSDALSNLQPLHWKNNARKG